MSELITVFEMGHDGDVASLMLPVAWAATHERVAVVFDYCGKELGWKASLESPEGDVLLAFIAHHADRILRGESLPGLPDPLLPDGYWDDIDEGWFAAVHAVGAEVFLAEGLYEDLPGREGTPVLTHSREGHVDVSGSDVRWSRVPRASWDEAWDIARESCLRGEPTPARRGPLGGLVPRSRRPG